MVKSTASSVVEYLDGLPEERRAVVASVRAVVLAHLPAGYEESLRWGMISYEIPLERFPSTYNGQPLGYAALAAQKNYYALHLLGTYQDPQQQSWLRGEFEKAGKKLNMGKSCVRFRKLEDLPLEVIGRVIASTTVEDLIAAYQTSRKK